MMSALPASPHISVLYHQIIHALSPKTTGRYLDATVGAGGHAWGILEASSPNGLVLGLDLDPQALEIAHQRLAVYGSRVILIEASYTTLLKQMQRLGWHSVDGILIDLGVSSMQLDTPHRGFSFQTDGPLDMRFSPNQAVTAADLLNQVDEAALADILWRYGEERLSRRIARVILQARPLRTTRQLAEVIARACGGGYQRIHPATRTFQALRIATNDELKAIETVLPDAISALAAGGKLAVISFHSLEDRIVKQFFRRESRDCICPPEQPVCTCGHKAILVEVNRHPIEADAEEIQVNPRARSARLRIAEKRFLA